LSILASVLLLASCSFGDGPELVQAEPGIDTTETTESEPADTSLDSDGETAQNNTNEQVSQGQASNEQVADASSNQSGEADQSDGVAEDATPLTNTELDGAVVDSEPVANDDSNAEGNSEIATETETETETETAESVGSLNNNRIVRIPRTDTANAPKIDGQTLDYLPGTELLAGEWRFAAQFDSFGDPLGVNNFMFGEPDSDQSSGHHWAAMHDGVYLYLLVVSDDAGIHFQDTNELRKPWKDDSVELFIDGNRSMLTDYDGVDDFHMTVNLLSEPSMLNSSYVNMPLILQSDASAILPSDLIFSTGPQKGPTSIVLARGRKDIYEFRIKISELNIEVEAPFGIEIQLNDDDDGGTRDAKWGWNHPEGNDLTNDLTWQNPSVMGTAILLQ